MQKSINELLTIIGDNPLLSSAIAAAMAPVWMAWKAFWAMVQRRCAQQWREHGPDDDEEMKVQRVTDKTQASSAMMSILPRGVVEARVRKARDSDMPPRPPAN